MITKAKFILMNGTSLLMNLKLKIFKTSVKTSLVNDQIWSKFQMVLTFWKLGGNCHFCWKNVFLDQFLWKWPSLEKNLLRGLSTRINSNFLKFFVKFCKNFVLYSRWNPLFKTNKLVGGELFLEELMIARTQSMKKKVGKYLNCWLGL